MRKFIFVEQPPDDKRTQVLRELNAAFKAQPVPDSDVIADKTSKKPKD
jgi:hypothetical protein